MPISKTKRLFVLMSLLWMTSIAVAAEIAMKYGPLSPNQILVPQTLLHLAHTAEIQTELQIPADKQLSFENILRDIDLRWWPSRILPVTEQRKRVTELESEFIRETEKLLGGDAVMRLRQIELQSQSSRILVRSEVVAFLELDAKQQKTVEELFVANDKLAVDVTAMSAKEKSEKLQSLVSAKQTEAKKAIAVLNTVQRDRIQKIAGTPVNTATAERIYALAPELIDTGNWTSEDRPTLESLRGQVVILHIYAFQCHNCVANFRHYKRWDENLKSKGVQVVGIQTPETQNEKDPEKVRAAAAKEGFQFPVLIDLENKNWKVWGNTMWPTVYVIDKKGYIRFWWQGELNWQGNTVDQKIDTIVEKLLSES
ncbi:MAG: redoxin domain-containing protein [Pirellulaceae bacterium]|nr:redoxin domain-containing protein [Pirellulaceae bacterium]